MKLVLIRNKGGIRTLQFGWPGALAAVSLVLGFALVLNISLYPLVVDRYFIPGMVDQWRQHLASQDARVRELEKRALAESGAVGRQLAQMRSSLWRLEALGIEVADVASIPLDEFGFNQPAPIGGPEGSCETILDRPNLRSGLDELAIDIRDRQYELEVLEKLLGEREYQDESRLAGWPVRRGWISSPYGRRVDPITGNMAWHAGMDFAGRAGADVIAIAAGVVTFAGQRKSYGNMVEVDHGDGYVTRYAHQNALRVEPGDIVKRGDVLGALGSTGRSTGPHVHIEVIKNGRHVNPARYVASRNS